MLRSSDLAFRSITNQSAFNFSSGAIKILKQRIKSVSNIGKITKAMKMVAASKMRGDLVRLDKGKKFGVNTVTTILANESYLQKKKSSPVAKRTLLVPLTSDKGLCGGINSGIVREIKAIVKPNRDSYRILAVGEKGTTGLIRPCSDLLVKSISEIPTPINFMVSASIVHQILQTAEANSCDGISILYNEFKSAISSVIRRQDWIVPKDFAQQFKYVVRHDTEEPDKEYASQYYYELYTNGQFYHALLNNLASEQSARMNAMENASKNAGELLEKIMLNYNKARQAKITMELCEIISGASAV